MMPTTIEWIDKAEIDFEAAGILVQSRLERQASTVCYHCQQACEKYLKAVMQDKNIFIPKIHDLSELLDHAVKTIPMLESHRESCRELTPYAIIFRYPGFTTTREDAKRAFRQCENIRVDVRRYFGLETK